MKCPSSCLFVIITFICALRESHRDAMPLCLDVSPTGVSTAFAAPIGGLLLAIEEGSSFLNLGIFWRGFLATCTGVLTLHSLALLHEDRLGIWQAKLGIRRDLG